MHGVRGPVACWRCLHSQQKQCELDNLDSLSHKRWRHIRKIPCVFPNNNGQILGAKSLDAAAHYQSFYPDIKEAIEKKLVEEIEAILPELQRGTIHKHERPHCNTEAVEPFWPQCLPPAV
jgi:hypothetical protein